MTSSSSIRVFARVIFAAFTGLADALTGAGLRFARAHGRIMLDDTNLTVEEAIAYGPGLGLRLDGTVGREGDVANLVGLVAPAYSLSRLIDRIPVLGELLTGGEGEGLLATEFRIDGDLSDPTITVNPLTALTPGFLRQLVSTAERPAEGPATAPGSSLTLSNRSISANKIGRSSKRVALLSDDSLITPSDVTSVSARVAASSLAATSLPARHRRE